MATGFALRENMHERQSKALEKTTDLASSWGETTLQLWPNFSMNSRPKKGLLPNPPVKTIYLAYINIDPFFE